jgi:mannose-6-phosphate isomerase-like protein (cupin superfamily)
MSIDTPQQQVDGRATYQRYIENEGVPIIEGLYIQDLKQVPVADWARTGVKGAIVRLQGAENLNDAYVLEIGPGQSTTPRHHMYEELIYVVQGRGATTIWNTSGTKTSFEWGPGSVFCIPLNAQYQHHNGSGSEPARYYAVTSAPLMMTTRSSSSATTSSSPTASAPPGRTTPVPARATPTGSGTPTSSRTCTRWSCSGGTSGAPAAPT